MGRAPTSNERAATIVRAQLGTTQFERLRAEGTTLRDSEIIALAFAREDAR
jgi:hypothetical protein